MSKSYLDLDVYQNTFNLFFSIHEFPRKLPKYELYEQGSQPRRSADSINGNIVEGYGRKNYKGDLLRFLTYSRASNDETVNHLRKIATVHPHLSKEALELSEQYRQPATPQPTTCNPATYNLQPRNPATCNLQPPSRPRRLSSPS